MKTQIIGSTEHTNSCELVLESKEDNEKIIKFLQKNNYVINNIVSINKLTQANIVLVEINDEPMFDDVTDIVIDEWRKK